ncbi:hypothetical protein HN018_13155 [Lichenicola cladoniae]|uniref:Uncharacterized protein n=1 Tax=Lichenicola cladoniae TaxID=1484109 RepID=A0A6M8HQW0_9PROT|nr:hypothetical protein [Lichenicola cladoniae]NPD68706.1 hypothetical protein [Acetobacteraceae bacterium]QKE90859.1 hypothetical protein HN018_13155 [Lichenicola cladoniae]
MLLYHYTSLTRLGPISVHGLWKGDVVLGTERPGELLATANAVWLTTDTCFKEHGLSKEKREVRLTVDISNSDDRLTAWVPWARKNVNPVWFAGLVDSGGGDRKAETWFIYDGIIPAYWIKKAARVGTGRLITRWADGRIIGRPDGRTSKMLKDWSDFTASRPRLVA